MALTDPIVIQQTLIAGEKLFASKTSDELNKVQLGCTKCSCKDDRCIEYALLALRFQVDNNLYNGTTESLYETISKYVGNITITSQVKWTLVTEDPFDNLPAVAFDRQQDVNTPLSSLSLNLDGLLNPGFLVVQIPIAALNTLFNKWDAPGLDGGSIPDFAFRDMVSISGYYYIVSRNQFNYNPTNPIITFSHV